MQTIGIDPGVDGAIVSISPSDGIQVELMPTFELRKGRRCVDGSMLARHLRALTSNHGPAFCCIENVHSMPGQGVAACFSFGRSLGIIEGVCAGICLPFILVTPQQWQKVMHTGTSGDTPKARSVQAATRLFPDVDLRATPRSHKPHSGIVDALLIARFGQTRV